MTMPCGENSVSMRRTSAAAERGIVQPLVLATDWSWR